MKAEAGLCEYVTDHFASRRCKKVAPYLAQDRDGWERWVCGEHALTLLGKGVRVRSARPWKGLP